MKEVTPPPYYIAADGKQFTDKGRCEAYEADLSRFAEIVTAKIGTDWTWDDLQAGAAKVRSLPTTAPWFGGLGACRINITDIRRNADGKLEFQLADENNKPYEKGRAWAKADQFPDEWPQ